MKRHFYTIAGKFLYFGWPLLFRTSCQLVVVVITELTSFIREANNVSQVEYSMSVYEIENAKNKKTETDEWLEQPSGWEQVYV